MNTGDPVWWIEGDKIRKGRVLVRDHETGMVALTFHSLVTPILYVCEIDVFWTEEDAEKALRWQLLQKKEAPPRCQAVGCEHTTTKQTANGWECVQCGLVTEFIHD